VFDKRIEHLDLVKMFGFYVDQTRNLPNFSLAFKAIEPNDLKMPFIYAFCDIRMFDVDKRIYM
jgi:hypothetical protein